jgi:hypothetical protein
MQIAQLIEGKGETMDERIWTIPEAAAKTRLSIAWWRQAVFQKKVRYLKIGRRVLIPDSTLMDLLSNVVEPIKRLS